MAGGEASAIYEQFAHTPLKIRPPHKATTTTLSDGDHAAALLSTPCGDVVPATPDSVAAASAEKDVTLPQQKLHVASSAEVPAPVAAAEAPLFSSPSGPSPPPLLPPSLLPAGKELRGKLQSSTHTDPSSRKGSKVVKVSSTFAKDGKVVKATAIREEASAAAVGKANSMREGSAKQQEARSRTASGTTKTSAQTGTGEAEPVAKSTVRGRKTKRVSHPVKLANPSSDGITGMDSSTQAARPAKRSRKMALKKDDSKSSPTGGREESLEEEALSESRSLLSAFIHCIGDDEKELSTPQKISIPAKKRPARKWAKRPTTPRRSRRILLSLSDAEVPPDYITDTCDELLKTDTISGALFSVALNSIRNIQDEFLQTKPNPGPASNPFQSVSGLCMGIASCEQLAASQNDLNVKLSLLSRRRGSKPAIAKKSVRFQSFDLSCLNLHYVTNEHAEALVDKLLCSYDEIMRNTTLMLQQANKSDASHTFEARILRELVRIVNDKSMLFINPDTLETEAERIYLAAFGSRDPHTQYEIQASRPFFAKEFEKLVDSGGSVPVAAGFLQDMFSSLASSSMRFKLRALFLEYDPDESENDQNASAIMATYPHQDFGSAVHWGLQESLMYKPLAEPVIALLDQKNELVAYLESIAMDDFEHIEQYLLARRFLGYHVKKAYEAPSPDGFATRTWARIEQLCGIAKRYEYH